MAEERLEALNVLIHILKMTDTLLLHQHHRILSLNSKLSTIVSTRQMVADRWIHKIDSRVIEDNRTWRWTESY